MADSSTYFKKRTIRFTVTFNGSSVGAVGFTNIATITGRVRVDSINAFCTSSLTSGGSASLSLGTSTAPTTFLAGTTYSTVTSNKYWTSGSASDVGAALAVKSIFQTIGINVTTAAVTGGVIDFVIEYTPLTSDGNLSPTNATNVVQPVELDAIERVAAKRNTATKLQVILFDAATGLVKGTPTLAAGDVQISKDNGTWTNLTTLPSEEDAGSGRVLVSLTATETNVTNTATIRFKDQTTPAEWSDKFVVLDFALGNALDNIQLPSNGLANVTAWTVALTGNITGNLSGSVGSVTAGVKLGVFDHGGTGATLTLQKTGGTPLKITANSTTSPAVDIGNDTTNGIGVRINVDGDNALGAYFTCAGNNATAFNLNSPGTGGKGLYTNAPTPITGNITGNLSGSVGSVTANVNAKLANGVAHGGSTATLQLGGGSAPAVTIDSSNGNGTLQITNQSTGAAALLSADSGTALYLSSLTLPLLIENSGAGNAVEITSADASAVSLSGNGSAVGALDIVNNHASGMAVRCNGPLGGVSFESFAGYGLSISNSSGTTPALHVTGKTKLEAFATNGDAIEISAVGTGASIKLDTTTGGTGFVLGDIHGTLSTLKAAEADLKIDTSNPAQYTLVAYERGTSTVLFTKNLKKIDGTAVTSTADLIGRMIQP